MRNTWRGVEGGRSEPDVAVRRASKSLRQMEARWSGEPARGDLGAGQEDLVCRVRAECRIGTAVIATALEPSVRATHTVCTSVGCVFCPLPHSEHLRLQPYPSHMSAQPNVNMALTEPHDHMRADVLLQGVAVSPSIQPSARHQATLCAFHMRQGQSGSLAPVE